MSQCHLLPCPTGQRRCRFFTSHWWWSYRGCPWSAFVWANYGRYGEPGP